VVEPAPKQGDWQVTQTYNQVVPEEVTRVVFHPDIHKVDAEGGRDPEEYH